MPRLRTREIAIEYDSNGPKDGVPIVLISGLGTQMIRWTLPFCRLLAVEGYRVIRFDNRDTGLSTHFKELPVPDFMQIADDIGRGRKPDVPYTLDDMADDVIGLLDALSIERAHLVGRSMGGMIAQLVAIKYPNRTRSLATIMSSTGNRALPSAKPEIMEMMVRPSPHPLDNETAFITHNMDVARRIGSPIYPFDEIAQRQQILSELRRAYNPPGFARHIAAIAATGDLRTRLSGVTAPTLVIHGSEDPLVPVACGEDIAANINGADLMIIDGMGHDLPPALYEVIAGAIIRNAER